MIRPFLAALALMTLAACANTYVGGDIGRRGLAPGVEAR